jgi:signal transduction histidine kinase
MCLIITTVPAEGVGMSQGDVHSISLRGIRYRDLRLVWWSFIAIWLAVLVILTISSGSVIASDSPRMIGWVLLAAVFNLLPVEGWQSAPFSADDPILLAAALIFTPVEAAMITFAAAMDPREFKRQTTLAKSLYNRSQLSLSWFLGSLAAHLISKQPPLGAILLPLSFLVLGVSTFVNYSMVALSIAWERRYQIKEVLPKLKIGISTDFIVAFLAWASLAAMLAALYRVAHNWALLAFLAPLLLGRQALERSQMFIDTAKARKSAEMAFAKVTHQIDQERSDERRLVAADLHDEVLQPLFKLALMGHVLRAEVTSNRFAEMASDLDDLVETANGTIDRLRDLVGDLRQPGLGSGGVTSALVRLVGVVRDQTKISLHTSVGTIRSNSTTELVLYQIAKEALNNSVHHSGASNLSVELSDDDGLIRLIIYDDGRGFDPYAPRDGHYGIDLMCERATAIGGSLFLDSSLGEGTKVTVLVPSGPNGAEGRQGGLPPQAV